MALVKCEKCGEKISDNSKTCIHCGEAIIKKIKCSECGKNTVLDKDACEFCGCPIKGKEKIKNDVLKIKDNKFVVIGISVFVVLIIVFSFVIPIVLKNNKLKNYKNIYENLLIVSEDIEIVASDLYSSWRYGIYEDYHSRYFLDYEVSLDYDDLDNYYCSNVYSDEWIYSVQCVKTAHENLGHYNDIKNSLNSIKTKLSKVKNKKSDEYIMLNDFYVNLNNYYKLAYDYGGSFNSLQTDISNYRNSIKNNISQIDLLLDFDSDSFLIDTDSHLSQDL